MEMLRELGIDSTLFYQLGIFCVSYFFLTQFLFKPYLKAYHKRLEGTKGHQETAEKLNKTAESLNTQFEHKAREINTQVQSYFENAHKEAQAVQAVALESARKEADALVHKTRTEIQLEKTKAREELKKLIPELGANISKKLLNREA